MPGLCGDCGGGFAAVAFYQSIAQPYNAVGVIGDIFFMGNEDDGVAGGLDATEDIHDLDGGLGVEVPGRLIGEDEGGVIDQRPGNSDALALTTGELVGLMMAAIGEIHLFQYVHGSFDALFCGYAGIDEGKGDILDGGEPGQQVELLEDEADLYVPDVGEAVVVHFADILAIQNIFSGGGGVEAAKDIHQRTLTGSGGTHQGYIFILQNIEGYSFQYGQGLLAHQIAFVDVFQMDDRRCNYRQGIEVLFSDNFWHFEIGPVGSRGGSKGFFTGNGTPEGIFAQDIDLGAHVQQGFDAGSIQFAELFDEGDHLLQIVFDGFLLGCVELQAGEV
jgi:hypothetical protein